MRRLVLLVTLVAIACRSEQTPQPLAFEELPAPVTGDAAEPFVSTTPDGEVILTWLARETDSTTALRFATLNLDDATWSETREVVRRPDLFVNWADFPSLVTLEDGTLLAHWLQRNGTGSVSYDVHLAQSDDDGKTWGPSALPHAAGVEAEHGFVSILPDPKGGADVLFLDGSAGAQGSETSGKPSVPMQLGAARWEDGTVASRQIADPSVCDCCQTALARTMQGVVGVYRDRSDEGVRDMAVIRKVDGQWTAPSRLHEDGWAIDFCPVNGPAVSAVADTVAAAWFTAAQGIPRVNVVFSTDAGATFTAPWRIDGGQPTGRLDVELLDGNRALVSWIERVKEGATEVRARVIRRDGTMERPVVITPTTATRASGFPRMTRVAGGAVLAWTVAGTPSGVKVAMLRTEAK